MYTEYRKKLENRLRQFTASELLLKYEEKIKWPRMSGKTVRYRRENPDYPKHLLRGNKRYYKWAIDVLKVLAEAEKLKQENDKKAVQHSAVFL